MKACKNWWHALVSFLKKMYIICTVGCTNITCRLAGKKPGLFVNTDLTNHMIRNIKMNNCSFGIDLLKITVNDKTHLWLIEN